MGAAKSNESTMVLNPLRYCNMYIYVLIFNVVMSSTWPRVPECLLVNILIFKIINVSHM